jgi:hypothetical protein
MLEFHSRHVLVRLMGLLYHLQYPRKVLPALHLLFCNPIHEWFYVSEEGRLERRRNARKTRCHFLKRPTVVKRKHSQV